MRLSDYLEQSFYTIKLKETVYTIDAELTFPDVKKLEKIGMDPVKVLIYLSKNLKIPKHDIKQIKPLEAKVKGDLRTCEYTFENGRLEVSDYNGFYYIPGFTKYALNNQGTMINVRTGKTVVFSINGAYLKSTVMNDLNKLDLLPKHRALCLVFKNDVGNTDEMHVNHDDCDTLNNLLDNIYFCTPKFNTNHYHENKTAMPPVEAINLYNGKEYVSDNIYSLSRLIDSHATTIVKYLLKNQFLATKTGYMFRYKGDESRLWPEGDQIEVALRSRNGFEKMITGFNIYHGYNHVFKTVGTAARELNMYGSTISEAVNGNHMVPINGWIFREFDEDGNYQLPEYDDIEIKAMAENNRIIKLYKLSDGKETLCFSSWSQMGRYFNANPDTLRTQKEDTGIILKRYKVIVKELRK